MPKRKEVRNLGLQYIYRGALYLSVFSISLFVSNFLNFFLILSMILVVFAGLTFRIGFSKLSSGHKVGYISSFLLIAGSPLVVLSLEFPLLNLIGSIIEIAGLLGISFEYYWIYNDYKVKNLNYSSVVCLISILLFLILGKILFSLVFFVGQLLALRSLKST